jgi:ubiquitin-activating enzyme E1
MDFVVAAANLRASVYGIEGTRNVQTVRDIVAGIKVAPFSPRENVRIAANDAEAEAQVICTLQLLQVDRP